MKSVVVVAVVVVVGIVVVVVVLRVVMVVKHLLRGVSRGRFRGFKPPLKLVNNFVIYVYDDYD